MEYTTKAGAFAAAAGNLGTNASSTGYVASDVAIGINNYVPLFDMPGEAFNTLRTWYGRGYVTPGTPVAGSGVLTGFKND